MATYTIRTTRQQEVGLKFSYDHHADHTIYPTQEAYFQAQIDAQVTDPMFVQQQAAKAKSFDESFKTIPELEQPAASTEIEAVITGHGGTIVPPPSVVSPAPQLPQFTDPNWLPEGMEPPPVPEGMAPAMAWTVPPPAIPPPPKEYE